MSKPYWETYYSINTFKNLPRHKYDLNLSFSGGLVLHEYHTLWFYRIIQYFKIDFTQFLKMVQESFL